MSSIHYYGDWKIADAVIRDFSYQDCFNFLEQAGLLLKTETDSTRVYPYSNRADTVLDCLRAELKQYAIEEICEFDVQSIRHTKNGFIIQSENNTIIAENLIFACGAKASPSLGADESGFALLESLGISHTPLYPALCPISVKESYPILKGVRAAGCVTLMGDGKEIDKEYGEIQFSDRSLSGICVFNLSGQVNHFFLDGSINGCYYNKIRLSLDLMAEYDVKTVTEYCRKSRSRLSAESAELLLSGALNKKTAAAIIRYAGFSGKRCKDLNDRDLKSIAYAVKHFDFIPTGEADFRNAQVCGGGICSKEIAPETLMSYKVRNLFICGEMLDCYGICGGYNLHFAIGSALKVINHIH